MTPDVVLAALRGYQFNYINEDELQQGVAAALALAGIPAAREVRLNTANRIDFMCDTVGIEVKVGGSAPDLIRQVRRYLTLVDHVVVVTTRAQHVHIGWAIDPDRVTVLKVGGL